MLCVADRSAIGRLGVNPLAPLVKSKRYGQEKEPWKSAAGVEANVEVEFLRNVLLGESILPYRVFKPVEGIVPVDADGTVLNSQAAANRGFGGLHRWMNSAEAVWDQHKTSKETLSEQLNHHNKLAAQFPLARRRVVYAKAGTLPAACVVRETFVIDHMLYWAEVPTEEEGAYLAAIFNSETARARVAALQARGQFGARHFDKVIFTLPIARFDNANSLHADIVGAGRDAEVAAAGVTLPDDVKFQRARKIIRDALIEEGIAPRIEELVTRLLA